MTRYLPVQCLWTNMAKPRSPIIDLHRQRRDPSQETNMTRETNIAAELPQLQKNINQLQVSPFLANKGSPSFANYQYPIQPKNHVILVTSA
jgi:hypothetical protein